MMKALLLFAGVLLIVQSPLRAQYTEDLFREDMKQYAADPIVYYKDRVTPDFQFVAGNGRVYNLDQTIGVYKVYKELARTFDEIKIESDNKMAIARGTFIHRLKDIKSGDTLANLVYFQYNLLKQGASWKLTFAQHTDLVPSFKADELALRAVIEAETNAFMKADFNKNRQYHSKGPYTSFVFSEGQLSGESYKRALTKYWETNQLRNAEVERSDWSFRVNRYSAYVTFTQVVTDASQKVKTYETRYLERENGNWKIVGIGVVNAM